MNTNRTLIDTLRDTLIEQGWMGFKGDESQDDLLALDPTICVGSLNEVKAESTNKVGAESTSEARTRNQAMLEQSAPDLIMLDQATPDLVMLEDPNYTFVWETEKARAKRLESEAILARLKAKVKPKPIEIKQFDFVSALDPTVVGKHLEKTPRYLAKGKKAAKTKISKKKARIHSLEYEKRSRRNTLWGKWKNLKATYDKRKKRSLAYSETNDIFEFYPSKRNKDIKSPNSSLKIPKYHFLNNDFLLTFEEYASIYRQVFNRYGYAVQDCGVGTPFTDQTKGVNYAPIKMGRIVKTKPFELGNIEVYLCVGNGPERDTYKVNGLDTPNGQTLTVREYTKPLENKWDVPPDADTWGIGYLTLYRERLVLLRA